MKNFAAFFAILSLFSLTACLEDPIEPVPTEPTFEGHSFFIEGAFGSESFRFSAATNSTEVYYAALPFNDDAGFAYGTLFNVDETRTPAIDHTLIFTFSRDEGKELTEILQPGTYDWAQPLVFPRGATKINLTSIIWDQNSTYKAIESDFNRFEVSEVTPLTLSDNDQQYFEGNYYKVEGSFQVQVIDENQPGDTLNLIVDEFSALFNDRF